MNRNPKGAEEIAVTLPGFGAWRLRGEGEPHAGDETLRVPCGPVDLPVWFEKTE